jgi:hypothetical protein
VHEVPRRAPEPELEHGVPAVPARACERSNRGERLQPVPSGDAQHARTHRVRALPARVGRHGRRRLDTLSGLRTREVSRRS